MKANGAFGEDTDIIISIVNPEGSHWMAFYIDKRSRTCVMYDPLSAGTKARLQTLKLLIRENVESILPTRLQYRTFTDLEQDDGDSCGVYCGLFIEIQLHNVPWRRAWASPTPFFRARYMTIVSKMLQKLKWGVEEDEIVLI